MKQYAYVFSARFETAVLSVLEQIKKHDGGGNNFLKNIPSFIFEIR